MSTENQREPIETITRELAIAIQLVDAYTDQPLPPRQMTSVAAQSKRERRGGQQGIPSDVPTISISDVNADPIANPSGYLLYFREDFPDDPGVIEINVTGGGRYVDKQASVDLSDRDTQKPEKIKLQPLPAYRFPAGATLVRGQVFVIDEEINNEDDIDLQKFGEEGVQLRIEELGSVTRTITNGEFVLFITGITADDVENGLVQVDDDNPVLVIRRELRHDEFEDASIPIEIPEGDTRCYQVKFDINEDEDVLYRECGTKTWSP